MDESIKAALELWGRIDVLVNNAGYGQLGPLEAISCEEMPLRKSILVEAPDWISEAKIARWKKEPDLTVIEQRLSPACYIPDAFPAALYLAWKYSDDFGAGICANAEVGGDSCHRGAVVGGILGLVNGVPDDWLRGLDASETTSLIPR